VKTIQIKPTNQCNLNCAYCYNHNDDRSHGITAADLPVIFNKIKDYYSCEESIQIIWHGGEPLMAGCDFYQAAYSLSKEIFTEHRVSQAIQTNGTLLTHDLIDKLVSWDIGIGISLDGFDVETNSNRHLEASTIDTIVKSAEYVKSKQGSLGLVVVLSRANIAKLNEIIIFFSAKGIDLKFNPAMETCNNQYSLTEASVDCFVSAYDYYSDNYDQLNVKVDPFYSMTKTFFSKVGHSCHFGESCADDFLSISADGKIYPCARFEDNEFVLGDIFSDELIDVERNKKRLELTRRKDSIKKECAACQFISVCHGGCPHSSYVNKDNYFSKDPLCFINKALYTHIDKKISKHEGL
jgi:uncharacterized protein